MFDERKLAVLIDSDNVPSKYAQFIMQEVSKYGTPTYKRVYGDWENNINGWRDAALNYSILAVQQSCYVTGKNATDFAMIIDAMDILYTGNVDGFVLVTSDSDFTRLAIKLREAGKLVVGMGALKTPRAFTVSCHHFCYLNQTGEPEFDEKAIRQTVIDFVKENGTKRLDLQKISDMLTAKYGNINFSEMGYKRFSGFIDNINELRRSNTFVTLKKTKEEFIPTVENTEEITESNISKAISEYLAVNKQYNDNMMKIESYLCSRFGKIDFSRFGSKRFAKFIDKQPQLKREGTTVTPVVSSVSQKQAETPKPEISVEVFAREALSYAQDNMPNGGNIGQLNNSMISKYGRNYIKDMGFNSFKAALDSVVTVSVDSNLLYVKSEEEKPVTVEVISIDSAAVVAQVKAYAEENMPSGGNIGQLNNLLINSYGKEYCSALGFADFKSMLSSVDGVYVKKNHIFTEDGQVAAVSEIKPESEPIPEPEEIINPQENTTTEISTEQQLPETPEEITIITEEIPVDEIAELPPTEKPDMNTIRREMLHYAAVSENGGSLSGFGKVIAEKYGKSVLRDMGFTSMRKLAAEVSGIIIKNNKLYIDEAFAQQTEAVEQFVRDFANNDSRHSIRSLGIKLKKQFEGFDYRVYGYEKFTDFVNAIDGVKADRYYVKPVSEE